MTDVIIIGAGGAGREACWMFQQDSRTNGWHVLGFVDDNTELEGTSFLGVPVLGGFSWLERNTATKFKVICAVGNPRIRKRLVQRATALGIEFCTLIHPSVVRSRWVEIGLGSIISAGAILTTNVTIGPHVTINVASTISHDSLIGAFANINPGCHVAGSVEIGEGVELGAGAVVIQNRRIGGWSTIGAGAVVTSDLPGKVTAVGVPCRVIKYHEPQAAFAVGTQERTHIHATNA